MNLPRAFAAAAAALTLLVAGCSSQPPESDAGQNDPEVDAQAPVGNDLDIGDGSDVPMPQATGEFGDQPTFTWPDGDPAPHLQVQVVHPGDGELVAEGSTVVANYLGIVWGEDEAFDQSYDRGAPSTFSLNEVVAGWREGIPGHAIGSRLLITIPPELGYGPDGNPNAGIGGDDTIVFVVDVVQAVGAEALGEADAEELEVPEDVGVTIEGELGEEAIAVVDDGLVEPDESSVYQVSRGSGVAISAGHSVIVSYALTAWDNSETVATWMPELGPGAGPQGFVVGSSGATWDLLEGVEVGSRVLITQQATEESPPLAIVVDVLGAY